MVEANIHLRLLPTSILDINIVFQVLLLFCWIKGIWVHPPTITQAKLALNVGILGHLWSGNVMVEAYIHLRLLPTSTLSIYKVCEVLVC
jgi:hypothetical protein